jgi:hypothetical protein
MLTQPGKYNLATLAYTFGLSVPFVAIGPTLGSLILSPALISAFLLAIASVFSRDVLARNSYAVVIWILALALTSSWRNDAQIYAAPLLLLLLMALLGFSVRLTRLECASILNGYKHSLAVVVALSTVEFFAAKVGFGSVAEVAASVFAHRRVAGDSALGIRLAGGFREPADFVIYLVFSVFLLYRTGLGSKGDLLLSFGAIMVVVLAGSVTGYLLLAFLLVYILLAKMQEGGRANIDRVSSSGVIIACGMLAIFAVVVFGTEGGIEFISKIGDRIQRGVVSLVDQELVRSEGSRANAIPVLVDALNSEGHLFALIGTGFGSHEQYLIERFGYLGDISAFARGDVSNIYAAIGLSSGLVGLVGYLLLQAWFFFNGVGPGYRGLFAFICLAHFFLGSLLSAFFWSMYFLLCCSQTYCGDKDAAL